MMNMDINELRRLALDGDLAAMQEIIHRLEAAEKSDAESLAMYRKAKAEIDALRAKIERMERQEPAWFIDERGDPKRYHKSKADYCKYGGLDLLYDLPGAKT